MIKKNNNAVSWYITHFFLVIILCLPSEYLLWLLVQADALEMSASEYVFIYCRFGPVAQKHLLPSQVLGELGKGNSK